MAGCSKSTLSTQELLQTLQQLKVEKSRNELTLRELRQRRMKLEGMMEQGKMRLQSVRASNIMKRASLQQKQHRMAESEAEMNNLQEKVDGKKAWIDAQNRKMEMCKQASKDELRQFEARMTDLAEWFRQAKQFYTEGHLQKEIHLRKQKLWDLQTNMDENEETLNALIDQQFEMIYKQKEREDQAALTGFTAYDQEKILSLFERQKAKVQEKLGKAKAKRGQLKEKLADLEKANATLKKELGMDKEPSEESHMDTTNGD